MGYQIKTIGGYDKRMKSGRFWRRLLPEHAFGNAIDVDADVRTGRARHGNMPEGIAAVAAKCGLIRGGDWYGASRDPMHSEWSGRGSQVAGQ